MSECTRLSYFPIHLFCPLSEEREGGRDCEERKRNRGEEEEREEERGDELHLGGVAALLGDGLALLGQLRVQGVHLRLLASDSVTTCRHMKANHVGISLCVQ